METAELALLDRLAALKEKKTAAKWLYDGEEKVAEKLKLWVGGSSNNNRSSNNNKRMVLEQAPNQSWMQGIWGVLF